jgi:hypothetical protein
MTEFELVWAAEQLSHHLPNPIHECRDKLREQFVLSLIKTSFNCRFANRADA